MRKPIPFLLAAAMLFTSCGVVDKFKEKLGESESISTNSSEYILENQNKLCIQTAEEVFDAIKNHDTDALKDMFCPKVKNRHNLAEEIQKIYEFIDGDIESYNWISDPETGEEIIDGNVERLNGNPYIKGVKTSKGHEYNICVQIVLIYKDSAWEGVTQLVIHDTQSKAYLRVGQAFDY